MKSWADLVSSLCIVEAFEAVNAVGIACEDVSLISHEMVNLLGCEQVCLAHELRGLHIK